VKPETQDPQIAMPSASRLGVVWPPSCAPRHANVAGDGMPAASPRRSTDARLFLVYFVIAAVAWSVFGQTLQHQFVNYDDQTYVYENREVSAGLTWHGFIAAFTQPHAQNWHPLTTISHMVDCQIFGLDPAGHHLSNVLLHTTAALLLFSVLNGMTGVLWRSAFVAVLFAIHPLRAESVAWVAERKDLLSGVFFMLTLAAYVHYVRQPSLRRYLVTLLFFAFGLMAKPTVVALPVFLLLLDYWPLGRFHPDQSWRLPNDSNIKGSLHLLGLGKLLAEKMPFLVLSVASATITIAVQRHTVGYSQELPLSWRISNALISYVTYIGELLWPTKLAVFYPHAADRVTIWQVTLAALFLIVITMIAVMTRKKRPYLFVGWLWYLACLIPVIGIIQVGIQGHADRYTYLPQIGLGIALAWTVADLAPVSRPARNRILAIAGSVIVAVLAWRSWVQTSYWKDSETLWEHAVAVTNQNDVAHNNVAALLMKRGRIDDAIAHYEAALAASSNGETHNHLSTALLHNSLGNALARKGSIDDAIAHYRRAVQLRDDFSDAHSNLAAMLSRKGQIADAITEYEKSVRVPPEDEQSHARLAEMLLQAGRPKEAIVQYRRALEIAPQSANVLNRLAWLLATDSSSEIRNVPEAVGFAERANRLRAGNDPVVLQTLAASYAAAGRFSDAATTAERALRLTDQPALAQMLETEIKLYRAGVARAKGEAN
jgi:tetratricopeptide (TPR) repeat protein